MRFCDSPEELARALGALVPRPVAVVGVGAALCGDDGFGPAVVQALVSSPALQRFDVQSVPESFLVPIVESDCPGVLFVDAADLGAEPGRLALVPPDRLLEIDVSTHVVSLGLMAEAIRRLARERAPARLVQCALLAAQPASLQGADQMSPAVQEAVRRAAAGLTAFSQAPASGYDEAAGAFSRGGSPEPPR
jgi:hydrogenase maturation protease